MWHAGLDTRVFFGKHIVSYKLQAVIWNKLWQNQRLIFINRDKDIVVL
jgi:hypothetical protein